MSTPSSQHSVTAHVRVIWQDCLMRIIWVAWVTLALGLLFLGGLSQYRILGKVCSGAAANCLPNQLDATGANELLSVGLSINSYASLYTMIDLLVAIVFLSIGIILFFLKSLDPMARYTSFFFAIVSIGPFLQPLLTLYPSWALPIRLIEWIAASMIIPYLLILPDGKFYSIWTKVIAVIWVIGQTISMFFAGSLFDPLIWPEWITGLISIGFFGSALFSQIYRYLKVSNSIQRQQMKWIVYGISIVCLISIVGELIGIFLPENITYFDIVVNLLVSVAPVGIPIAIAVAILHYRLWDINVIINRSLVYGALTASVVLIYVAVVGLLGAILQMKENTGLSIIATGVVAVLFQPLRERVQRGINRFTFGDRDDPYAVITRLSKRLDANLSPEEVMQTIVETITQALKLPYVAVMIGEEVIASSGIKAYKLFSLPISWKSEVVGMLILSARSPEDVLSRKDEHLLEDLTRQAGEAIHSLRIMRDLQLARERLVKSREEERLRLRRDLHDGLGPALSSLLLRIDHVRYLAGRDIKDTENELLEMKQQVKSIISDIRRVVYQLRPPILDELGLIIALQALFNQYEQSKIAFKLISPILPSLPAAVEVAAYRIIQEAVTNVYRHSGANHCIVTISVDNGLCLQVEDDGGGISINAPKGVGLHTMKERAIELGGHFEIYSSMEKGTKVFARLPFQEENEWKQFVY